MDTITVLQVPSHYAPNYPLGHPRRTGVGYSTLPMASVAAPAPSPPPQVGMVHPLPQTPPPPPPPNAGYAVDHHTSMPREFLKCSKLILIIIKIVHKL